jgi:PTS system nitrogen regulatory IIA component
MRDILSPDRISLQQNISSKKKALNHAADLFAAQLASDANERDDIHTLLVDALTAREKLGSTALEHGIAIPHCRISSCQKPQAAIITLTHAIDFDARDQQPIDILWALIVPNEAAEEHLQILAAVVEQLAQPKLREAIRAANNSQQLYEQLYG